MNMAMCMFQLYFAEISKLIENTFFKAVFGYDDNDYARIIDFNRKKPTLIAEKQSEMEMKNCHFPPNLGM